MICPFMSKPMNNIFHRKEKSTLVKCNVYFVQCQKRECMAWVVLNDLNSDNTIEYCKLIAGKE